MKNYLKFLHYVLSFIGTAVEKFFRSLLNVMLCYFTGKGEFERAISNGKSGDYEKVVKLEILLADSDSLSFVPKESPENIEWVVETILEKEFGIGKKNVVENEQLKNEYNKNERLAVLRLNLKRYLTQILGYERLKIQVEETRTDFYNRTNDDHEKMLKELWSTLRPSQTLDARISSQWADELGFQGTDPATDFRGMGILGLEQLLYFSEHYNKAAVRIMEKSKSKEKGYPFAIVGISMTALLRDFLNLNILKRYFVTIKAGQLQTGPSMVEFHELYCRIFHLFDQFWYASEPESIMHYVPLRDRFRKNLIARLSTDDGIIDIWTLIPS